MYYGEPWKYGNPKDNSDYRPTTEADIQRAISEYKMFTLSRAELEAIIDRNTTNEFEVRTAAKAAERVLNTLACHPDVQDTIRQNNMFEMNHNELQAIIQRNQQNPGYTSYLKAEAARRVLAHMGRNGRRPNL
jgi:hypothetical protein